MTGPCKDCEDRHVACHSQCDKYSEWKEEVEKQKLKCRQEMYSYIEMAGYVKSRARANQRRKQC